MKILAALSLVLLSPFAAFAYCGSDATVSQYFDYENSSCVTPGYCLAYDYNPANNQYENFYGYHQSCPGHSQTTVQVTTCRRSNGMTYSTREVVSVGVCSAP